MPKHITSVIEFREAGIKLKLKRKHTIRVLGALKEVPLPTDATLWEDVRTRAEPSVYESYQTGSLKGPQDDPDAQPFHPRVHTLFITRSGEALFLKRDWT